MMLQTKLGAATPEQRDDACHVVRPAIEEMGRHDAKRHAEAYHQQGRREYQFQRRRQVDAQIRQHRPAGQHGLAPIPAEQAGEVGPILHRQWLVGAEFMRQSGNLGLRRLRPGGQSHRVAG